MALRVVSGQSPGRIESTNQRSRGVLDEIRKTVESLKREARIVSMGSQSGADAMSQILLSLDVELSASPTTPESLKPSELHRIRSLVNDLIEAEDHVIADKIVTSLNYDSRPVRHDSVPQAHRDTFSWAFNSHLAEWFRSGSGTFWISGKPGSGKSTFMKYVSTHERTRELLSSWAGSGDKLATAAHFFWIAGTPIQKSWQGLFQSLLFDTFHKHPAVIRLISPRRWTAAKSGDWQTAAEPWSVVELGAALRALATTPDLKLKLCFFIDGLDEYDSDHSELCDILYDVAQAPHIKICLSSRPWPVFEQRFGADSTRRMDIHELTKDDIQKFVADQLQLPIEKNPVISDVERDAICQKIASGADGVFLWAFFVTKTLREEVAKGSTLADIHNRLDGLPGDLEQLFKKILDSVDTHSHSKMAGILLAASHAFEPLHIDLYRMLEKESDIPNYVLECPVEFTTLQQLSVQREQIVPTVYNSTKGLLKLVNHRFEFLHRTVKDFVMTQDTETYLLQKLPSGYNSYTAIATAYLGYLKTTRMDSPIIPAVVRLGQGRNSGPFTSHLNQALLYTAEALKSDMLSNVTELLREYEKSIQIMISAGHITMNGLNADVCDPRLLFREELLRHDVTSYISHKLQDEPDFLEIFFEPPLYFALMPMSLSNGESPPPVVPLLKLLLQGGQNPNSTVRPGSKDNSHDKWKVPSPWVLFARDVLAVFNMQSVAAIFPAIRFNDSINKGIFELLLFHGADPNASLLPEKPRGSRTAFSHFLDISLSQFLGSECFDGYLSTLDAFMRAGASLGTPVMLGLETSSRQNGEAQDQDAFGNLARERSDESVLASYCTELETLLPRLTADPERAKFVQSALTALISHCSRQKDELQRISSAISKGCPEPVRQHLLSMIEDQLSTHDMIKRNRGSWDKELSNSAIKHLKS